VYEMPFPPSLDTGSWDVCLTDLNSRVVAALTHDVRLQSIV